MTDITAAGAFPLGNRTVKRMGYGAMQLAGPGVFGPPKDRDAALAVLREAVASGVDHIDTSDFYGPHITNGLIREALHPYPDDLVIVTKVGAVRGDDASWIPASTPTDLTRAVHDNLRNLGVDVPQGSRLIGSYDSQVAFGQSRILLVWTRLILPNGRSIVLERQTGADGAGNAGLEDEVDNHWGTLFKAALLSTLLGVGTELGSTGDDSDIVRALRRGASDTLNQTGQQVVRRSLGVQPTLTIRPGFPVRVIVNRDLVLETYRA
jgi:hypothetical protein